MTTTVLHEYLDPITTTDGRVYLARACAEVRERDSWVAWFVFVPLEGGASVGTGRETTQSSLAAARYWAEGITPIYLEGALSRALRRTGEADHPHRRTKRRPASLHSPLRTSATAAG
jgi:hypothetical protein